MSVGQHVGIEESRTYVRQVPERKAGLPKNLATDRSQVA